MVPLGGTSEEFNARFDAWLRIEPRCRQDDWAQGIQARTADPLWMLARQWQTGEFRGEDAGSPIKASLRYSAQALDRVKLGDEAFTRAAANVPLEAIVEQELGQLNFRERVRVGQEFERRLRARLDEAGLLEELDGLLVSLRGQDTLGFPRAPRAPLHKLDRATQRFVRFMRGRVVDGEAVLDLDEPIAIPAASPLSAAELEEVRQEVVSWYGQVCARPASNLSPESNLSPAWQPESLDYEFRLLSPHPIPEGLLSRSGAPRVAGRRPEGSGSLMDYPFETKAYPDAVSATAVVDIEQPTRLLAPDYRNGTVDWYTFSAASEGAGSWQATAQSLDPVVTTPTRIEVSGTSVRWWAFEDAYTDFGAMDVAKPDLVKLLLMEFVLIYGDDWFSVPAPAALGSLVKVDELVVRNVFGDLTNVTPALKTAGRPAERFDLFTISPANAPIAPGIEVDGKPPRPLLFVPPVAGFRQESAPLDEVRFLRDEGANMVWGVEQLVPNGIGRTISGFDAQRERLERENEVERAALEALVHQVREQLQGIDEQLQEGSLSDGDRQQLLEERAQLQAQMHLAIARMEELNPYATPTPSQKDVPRYRLATSVPENWIPFIPVQRRDSPVYLGGARYVGIEFRRAKMLRNTDHAKLDGEALTPEAVQAAARQLGLSEDTFLWMIDDPGSDHVPSMSLVLGLNKDALLWLNEEAVPRAGLRVQLTKQRSRWIDGTTHVWLGRKVLTGRGEGASGLRFDVVSA